MIFTDESTVKIDKTVLPGLFKSIEITGDAIVDEQDVEGQTKKPKQATGYEDFRVIIELTLEDGPGKLTKLDKLKTIQGIFRKPGTDKPIVHDIINEHTAAWGLKKVIFKKLSHKLENKKSLIAVTLEFWEYSVITVKVTKKRSETADGAGAEAGTGTGSGASANLNDDYENYLRSRGAAPYGSPAIDTADPSKYLNTIGGMPIP